MLVVVCLLCVVFFVIGKLVIVMVLAPHVCAPARSVACLHACLFSSKSGCVYCCSAMFVLGSCIVFRFLRLLRDCRHPWPAEA